MAKPDVLTQKDFEALSEAAQTRPRLLNRLGIYLRHIQRINTLRRVMDPDDAAAVGNESTGTQETYQAEIDRRTGELASITPELRRSLAALKEGNNNG